MSTLEEKLDLIQQARDNIQVALNNKGKEVNTDIRTYADAINNISQGVKLFETIEEMQADTTAQEGDLAVVYRNEVQNATVDSKFQTATFPDTVVLDTAITSSVEVRYRAVDSSVMFDCMGQLNSSRFLMDCYGETGEVRIRYTSSDGITYTRTDTGNPVDFGTEIYYAYSDRWNDAIGKFIQIGVSTFEGLYKAKNKLTHTVNYNYRLENGEVKYDSVEYDFDQLYEDLRLSHSNGSSLKLVSNYAEGKPTRYWYSAYAGQCLIHYNGHIYFGFATSSDITDNYCVCYRDIGGSDVYPDISTATKVTINSINYYIFTASQTVDDDNIRYFCDNAASASFPMYYIENNTVYNIPIVANTGNYYPEWELAPTQLTATSDYIYEKEFYGKNGVETGTLQNKENLTKDEVKHRVDIWSNYNSGIICPSDISSMFSNCSSLTTIPLLDTSNATNMAYMFRYCTNLTTIPLLDTSNVRDMKYMFISCRNLTTIPLLDTSSVTSMTGIFTECSNLATIPLLDTHNVTTMSYVFQYCTNLTEIPLLDTSSVTDMQYMFYGCTSLTTIPLLNTSKVVSMESMVRNCTNLATIPLLDTHNVTTMYNMFTGCTSLTDESLNNILTMCKNATSYTKTKTLSFIGLTSEQANKCKTLSNYSAFTSAGWTTGY